MITTVRKQLRDTIIMQIPKYCAIQRGEMGDCITTPFLINIISRKVFFNISIARKSNGSIIFNEGT